MALSRYMLSKRIRSGKGLATSNNMFRVFNAVQQGNLCFSTLVLEEGQRLDTIAGQVYGSSSYWWVIAAASGIGWGLQVPPGTLLKIPNNIGEVVGLLL